MNPQRFPLMDNDPAPGAPPPAPAPPPAAPPTPPPPAPAAPAPTDHAAALKAATQRADVAEEAAKNAFAERETAKAAAKTAETEMMKARNEATTQAARHQRRLDLQVAAVKTVDPTFVVDLLLDKEGDPTVLVEALLTERPFLAAKAGQPPTPQMPTPPPAGSAGVDKLAETIRASRPS